MNSFVVSRSTGKERDAESNLDYFGARHYASSMGRFMTPDWAAKPADVPYANFGNPQSLNLYSYVENNPTTLGDPDGHQDDPCGCGPSAAQIQAVKDFVSRLPDASVTVLKKDVSAISAAVRNGADYLAGSIQNSGAFAGNDGVLPVFQNANESAKSAERQPPQLRATHTHRATCRTAK